MIYFITTYKDNEPIETKMYSNPTKVMTLIDFYRDTNTKFTLHEGNLIINRA